MSYIEKEGKTLKSLTSEEQINHIDEEMAEHAPVFGYELLRDILLPDLLGKDTREISYWAGKSLARKFPLLSTDEVISFFLEAGWGSLRLVEERRNEIKLELGGRIVKRRLEMVQEPCFRLEAGFLAEQFQNRNEAITEAHDEIIKKTHKVMFTVRWDKKDGAGSATM